MPNSINKLIQAISLMLLAALAFSLMTVGIRWSATYLHPFQLAFFRNFFGLIFMFPWSIHHGWNGVYIAHREALLNKKRAAIIKVVN